MSSQSHQVNSNAQDETKNVISSMSNLKLSPNPQSLNPSPATFANLVANIPPEVHARIEAFQKKSRSVTATSQSNSPGATPLATNSTFNLLPNKNSSLRAGTSPSNLDTMKVFTDSTTTMPVEQRQIKISEYENEATYKTTIPDYSKFHDEVSVNSTQKVQSSSVSTPNETGSAPVFHGAVFGQVSSSASALPKPSLSARRGLKLNHLDSVIPVKSGLSVPPISLPVTAPISQNLSNGRRPNKAGLKLNLGNHNLFSNHAKYVDVKKGSLNFAGKASLHAKGIDFSSGSKFRISLDELEPMGELGRGNYGTVTKVLHKPTNIIMAMKEIRLELDETKFSQIIMELDILHKCVSPYIVDFYGAFFIEGAVYVCMEYMDGGSLDKIYDGGVDEPYLAFITDAVVRGLKQLKEEHNIIHRDVKPTNILVSTNGTVKLCDFGVSGNLVASIARTNIGCQSYMAPERIKSRNPNDAITYTVQSDIWSLGLSILEVAKGSYPYPPDTHRNIFSQLSAIVDGTPPSLPEDRFSPAARSFVNACLNKVPDNRPTYAKLLAHPWLVKYRNEKVNLGDFVKKVLEKKENEIVDNPVPNQTPALHKRTFSTPGIP
jgi:mitogen-activated protein kinase kinase